MKWLAFKTFLKKAWVKAKRFWWAIVLGLLFVVVALVCALTRNTALFNSLVNLIESKNEAHDAELAELERIHGAEVDAKNLRLKEHEKRLSELKEEFAKRGETLDAEKEAELKRMVDEGYNDPEELAREIAAAFGLEHG